MRSRPRFAVALLVLALVSAAHPGVAADGQISDAALLGKIRQGSTTQAQVTETLGRPWRTERPSGGEVWEYWIYEGGKRVNVSVEFDGKGIVRSVERTRLMGGP